VNTCTAKETATCRFSYGILRSGILNFDSCATWGHRTSPSQKRWLTPRSVRLNLYQDTEPTAWQLAEDADDTVFENILAMFFTTSCQAELNTHINCDLADMTVLWLLSPTPETSLRDSCLKTCISVHKLILNVLYPHIAHCCILSTFQ